MLQLLTALLLIGAHQAFAADVDPYQRLIFVKIPDPIMPLERGEKYEDPIDQSLRRMGIGYVGGGGTQLSKDQSIEWVGVDIYVAQIDAALSAVKTVLHEHNVPQTALLELHYADRITEIPLGPPETSLPLWIVIGITGAGAVAVAVIWRCSTKRRSPNQTVQ